jgi:hypothetical protein
MSTSQLTQGAESNPRGVASDACEVAALSGTVRLDGYQDHDRAGESGRH